MRVLPAVRCIVELKEALTQIFSQTGFFWGFFINGTGRKVYIVPWDEKRGPILLSNEPKKGVREARPKPTKPNRLKSSLLKTAGYWFGTILL